MRRALTCFGMALLAATSLLAQQLALRSYTSQHGLAHSRVNCVHQDCRGFLWFGTWEGLSRFDGSRFVNLGVRDGLPNGYVSAIAEQPDGTLWVGTLGGGIARLRLDEAADGRRFDVWHVSAQPRGDDVFWLQFDRPGRLWLGTPLGMYRGTFTGGGMQLERVVEFTVPDLAGARLPDGTLCCADADLMVTVGIDGQVRTTQLPAQPGGAVMRLEASARGVLLARERALFVATRPDGAWQPIAVPLSPNERIRSLCETRDGTLWLGTTAGLLAGDDAKWHRYGLAQGLPDFAIGCLFQDRDDNVWIGTFRGGLTRLADAATMSFGAREGFADCNVTQVVEGSDGHIYATTDTSGVHEVFDDHVAHVPGGDRPEFASVHLRFTRDREGDWWLGTDHGVWAVKGPGLDLTQARRVGAEEGLGDLAVCARFSETGDGGLWFGSLDLDVHRFDRTTARWHTVLNMGPNGDASACRIVLDDRRGGPLLGSFDRLWRIVDGRLQPESVGGHDPLRPRSLLCDSRGWTWIGTRFQGVFAQRPVAAGGALHLDTGNGLASDAVWSIAEDRQGRMYFGTGRGISRFAPVGGRVQPFGGNGRLAGEVVNHLYCDGRERLWAATSGGLTRFDLSQRERDHAAPTILLTAVRIDGRAVPMDRNGVARLAGIELSPAQRSLEVEFVGLHYRDERPMRFQHRLHGVDADWSEPNTADMVQYSDLPAGEHRLLVRALDADGQPSEVPAELGFVVAPPLWRRSWFLAAVASGLCLLGWSWHRARLRRAVATERLRTQIAGDLHDEVGAGLAQIAILSEVARRRAEPVIAADLGEVAGLARNLREAMGDIVWALSRGNDTLADLVQRLRQLCNRLLEVDGTVVCFEAPGADALAAVPLSLERRRQLWLWCREALTNTARHAQARTVHVQLRLAEARLHLRIADDGIGFAVADAVAGNGLRNLRHRSERLDGRMHLSSQPGQGTELRLDIPLRNRRRLA